MRQYSGRGQEFPFPSRRTQKKTTSQALGPSLAPPTLADSLVGNLLIEERSSDGATNDCQKGPVSWTERRKQGRPAAQAGISKGSTRIDGQDEDLTHKLYAAAQATTNPCPCLNFPEKKQRPGYKYAAAPSSADSSPQFLDPVPLATRLSRPTFLSQSSQSLL